jgi:hypothetical protein
VQIVNRQADLSAIVQTLRSPGRFPSRLNRRQQEGNEDADNGDDNQQFDKGETM